MNDNDIVTAECVSIQSVPGAFSVLEDGKT